MESLRTNYPAPRRVATAPVGTPVPAPRSTSAGGLVETLYNHPNVKIVAFTAASRGRARSPGRGPADEPGTLSAYSQLERTIAIGPFRIYRTGSVAFLNCGSALQPMLPKSQCWALEEDSSKFVLQIRRPNYWRIEIPVTNPTEQELAAAFKGVLDQILQFEKTECPFQRSFTVILPEKPTTPMKKRPWTPPVKRALPVLSTPAHEVSPTPKVLNPNSNRRASTSLAIRGRTEQRRFSVTGTEFQSSSESRGTSTETSQSTDLLRDQEPSSETRSIAEEKTESEPLSTETIPQVLVEKTESDGAANTETAKPEEDFMETNFGITKEPDAKGPEEAAPATAAEEHSSKPFKVHDVHDDPFLSKNSDDEVLASRHVEDSAALRDVTEPGETIRPTAAVAVPSAKSARPSEEIDIVKPSNETKQVPLEAKEGQLSSASNQGKMETCSSKVTILEQPKPSISSPLQIKEQLVTIEAAPRTPSSFEADTPTPTNIYDVIRNYEQKLADAAPTSTPADEVNPTDSEPQAEASDTSDCGSSQESHSGTDGEVLEGSGVVGGRRKKLRGFRKGRALVPPQLTLVTSTPPKSAARQTAILDDTENTKESVSPTGSADSFHSVQSWHSPVTPVPRSPASEASPTRFPYPHDNILIPKKPWHYRDISDLTVTPETRRTWDATSSLTDDSSLESAATAPDMVSEVVEQPDKSALSEDEAATTAVARRPYLRHRATTNSISVGRRALSPLPPPANLFAPTATTTRRQPFLRSRLEIVRRIPMAIVSKTCEVLLGPPSHLITLMLQVAAKIAAGEWRGMMFGYGESGETIPVQWDYSDDEYSSWGDDDDYYLSQVESSRANSVIGNEDCDKTLADDNADGTGRGWEVD
ncbi:uncharacterized protein CTRU02_208927 [Colletotrichum truncatum]|uniref:Uncharacterized protein n=1 Tax=Colletotrichum truncatum TaxID=5467 RepID=A0ACC3YY07_COLTU|nr:uncharacterized protein CTRU02_07880 [Colletotrichum truncatum]KAF6790974.1 hypothetical protein CTRU02_07880 [Colletotrichum truncatum]